MSGLLSLLLFEVSNNKERKNDIILTPNDILFTERGCLKDKWAVYIFHDFDFIIEN